MDSSPVPRKVHLSLRLALLLLAVALPVVTAPPAAAYCATHDPVWVDGLGTNSPYTARGMKASFISPAADAECGIVRSIYVRPSGGGNYFAEVGLYENWPDDYPHPFVAWRGDAGYGDWHAGYTVSEGTFYGFRIQDSNANYLWSGYFTGALLRNTAVLPFNKGAAHTLTESDRQADPAFAHFKLMGWCEDMGCDQWQNMNIQCYSDDDPTAHFDRIGTNEHKTLNGQSQGGCAGAT